ncbi:MAG: calcium-binding protein, partial [Dolichospermum sp.]
NDALGGVDTVFSSVNFTLGFGLENLTLTGTGNINGTGNGNNNVITGNGANNILTGGLGADTLNGGDGSDTYYVDNAGDVVTELFNDALGGVDTVFSSVNFTLGFGLENLTLTGTDNINGTGNGNNNVITGNSANNILTGGLGADTLTGGLGADTFVFNSQLEGIDIIKDFQRTQNDKIQVSKIGFGATSLSQFNYNALSGSLSFLGSTFAVIENKPAGFAVSLDVVLV